MKTSPLRYNLATYYSLEKEVQDSLPFSVPSSSSSDAMFYYFNRPEDPHCNLFEAGNPLETILVNLPFFSLR